MSQSWKRKRKEIKTSGSNANSTWLKRGRALRGAKLAIRVGSQTGVGILEKYKEKKMARRLLINMQIVGGRAKFSLRVSLGSYHQRVFLSLTLLSFYLSVSLPLSYSPFFSFSLSLSFSLSVTRRCSLTWEIHWWLSFVRWLLLGAFAISFSTLNLNYLKEDNDNIRKKLETFLNKYNFSN